MDLVADALSDGQRSSLTPRTLSGGLLRSGRGAQCSRNVLRHHDAGGWDREVQLLSARRLTRPRGAQRRSIRAPRSEAWEVWNGMDRDDLGTIDIDPAE
jgi:hypothetical protein